MIGQVANVADVIANMQVPLHIWRPHSPEFSANSRGQNEVDSCAESP